MKTKIEFINKKIAKENIKANTHYLFIIGGQKSTLPFFDVLQQKLKRTGKKLSSLEKSPMMTELQNGAVISWMAKNAKKTVFEKNTLLRQALSPLIKESAKEIHVVDEKVSDDPSWCEQAAFVALVNAQPLISLKKEKSKLTLTKLVIHGIKSLKKLNYIEALVEGNTFTRNLTMTPPNDLTPTIYRTKIKAFAKAHKLSFKEYTMPQLKKMGAGSFYAVGQGSDPMDAAMVHLSYKAKGAKKTVALVGKGICFDTGGHNLKPAKYMSGMHEDMNGSAVALGILLTAIKSKVKVNIDCWLAIAQNHISAKAYKQNDVVKALNGTSIEIVHTDAEGRMVLADTLTMASRKKPDAMIDFATLTGCMAVAMGDRYSGVISNRPELACMAVGAGSESGERIAAFPYDEDYEEDLDSQIADIKQCTLEGGPDHIHAGRFLGKFVEGNVPWLHVDLSSSNRKGGLGAVSSEVNGFGVAFGCKMIEKIGNLIF
jgi:leucyl aminopeptidase